jgi:hypothetical protein
MFARIQLRENVSGRAAEFERRLSRDRLDVRHAANPVRSKNLLRFRHAS